MIEVNLEELETFYKDQLEEIFSKEKKIIQKLLDDINKDLVSIKLSMNHFVEAGKERIDDKTMRSLKLFTERIRKETDDIKIPEKNITYDNLQDLLNSIKKLFTTINEIARKSLPKFKKEVQPEIKELNYITRKLGKKQQFLDKFIRKRYSEIREAEDLMKKFPKLFTLKENIENVKRDIETFEKEKVVLEKKANSLNSKLVELEKNRLFRELEKEQEKKFTLKIKIDDYLAFKKALKKMKVELERESFHVPNINLNYIQNFLKNPINTLTKESRDLPKFRALLVNLRHALEENKLNLKKDKKEKTIEQINQIFEEKYLLEDLEQYKQIEERIKQLKKKIQEQGLDKKIKELKNEISLNAVKLEHLENDLDKKNKDYLRYLSSLKKERETLQQAISNVMNEEVKINIMFSF
ncbi:MAG: hypothetical protein ACTSU4_06965 [Promethearchaeota archaeon]